jgi:hypothetical protein
MYTQDIIQQPRYTKNTNERIENETREHSAYVLGLAEERERVLLEKHTLFDDILDLAFAIKAKLAKNKSK